MAQRQEDLALIERTRPICAGDDDCRVKWDAAQLYVVKTANYKIRNATNVLIETFNPGQYETGIAMQVTTEPQGGGKYKLMAKAWCNNTFGCAERPIDV